MGRKIGFLFFASLFFIGAGGSATPARYPGKLVSLDLSDTQISAVLMLFADLTGKNIVAHPKVYGKVRRLRLADVPVDQAFETFLRLHGLYAVEENTIVIVFRVEDYIEEMRERLKLKDY